MDSRFALPPSDDALWTVETLSAAGGAVGGALAASGFEFLLTRPPSAHPLFGTALLLWQRVQARFGERAPDVAAEALLALDHLPSLPGVAFALRVLEIWAHQVPLPLRADQIRASIAGARPDRPRLLEELALGGYEGGHPSDETLRQVAERPEDDEVESHAVAQLQRFARGQIEATTLAPVLAPALFGATARSLPAVTLRLLRNTREADSPRYTPAHTPELDAVLDQVRERATQAFTRDPDDAAALDILQSCARLRPAEILALSTSSLALPPTDAGALPPVEEMIDVLADGAAEQAVRVAWHFRELAGVAEAAGGLPGLTAWVDSLRGGISPLAGEVRMPASQQAQQWSAWLDAQPPERDPIGPQHRLLRALRTGQPIDLAEALLLLRAGTHGIDAVLFESSTGPGWLGDDGQLSNALRSWPAPARLVVAHPIDLVTAERKAWQQRLLERGRAPFNQLFRECHLPPKQERPRRTSAGRMSPGTLRRLRPRGWFPLIAPAECAPELDLGDVRAHLLLDRSGEAWSLRGINFTSQGKALAPSRVPPRLHSEAWRDVHESLALEGEAPAWQAISARAELVSTLEPALDLGPIRIETDHVARRETPDGVRIALGNALPSSGEVLPEAEARMLARRVLPFEDPETDVAPVLIGRLLHLKRGNP